MPILLHVMWIFSTGTVTDAETTLRPEHISQSIFFFFEDDLQNLPSMLLVFGTLFCSSVSNIVLTIPIWPVLLLKFHINKSENRSRTIETVNILD